MEILILFIDAVSIVLGLLVALMIWLHEGLSKEDLVAHIAFDLDVRAFFAQMLPRFRNRVALLAAVRTHILLLEANIEQVVEQFQDRVGPHLLALPIFLAGLGVFDPLLLDARVLQGVLFELLYHHG